MKLVETGTHNEWIVVAFLLSLQTSTLAFTATLHSPTDLEPAHLISGVNHWKRGHFDMFRVNPPLVRMIAAIPAIAFGCDCDCDLTSEYAGSRPEYRCGRKFIKANGQRSIALIVWARWACIPLSLCGSFFAYKWARDLYGPRSGLIALILYVCDPNLLGHGELITPDAAATSFGITASYSFWHWLRCPSWQRALLAGIALGIAELTKTTWLFLFILWPALWCAFKFIPPHITLDAMSDGATPPHGKSWDRRGIHVNLAGTARFHKARQPLRLEILQGSFILVIALYCLNLLYAFDGCGARLKTFSFYSALLTETQNYTKPTNRFATSIIGLLPIPLPREYVAGIDQQIKDLESYSLPSYLRGELRPHAGWWYYYLYGLLLKVPLGTWLLFAIVLFLRLYCRHSRIDMRAELVLLLPPIILMVIASRHTALNRHIRYVLPTLGFLLIFISQCAKNIQKRHFLLKALVLSSLISNIAAVCTAHPHYLAHFNCLAGGAGNGHRHLLGSNLDWGQDLFFLRDYAVHTGSIVTDIKYSDINMDLAVATIPHFNDRLAGGERIYAISPNSIEHGVHFPPEGARMLTPTLWIVRHCDPP